MANDFSGDPRCKAAWRFESGALLADSKGSHTLTNTGSVVADTANFWEGAASAYFNGSNNLSIPDANLDAGFPLKSGDTVKKGTICYWMKPANLNNYDSTQFSKFDYFSNKGSIDVRFENSGKLTVLWVYSGKTVEIFSHDMTFVAGHIYHVAVAFDGVNKVLAVRVYDLTNNIASTCLFKPVNAMQVDNSAFVLGAIPGNVNNYTGNLDEVVVLNDLLNDVEIDQIRQATFPGQSLPAFVPGSNNFSGDSRIKALYRFEGNPGLIIDSVGNNHLRDHGGLSVETTLETEGGQAGRFVHVKANWAGILDASLDPGFPLKNGDITKKGAWIFNYTPTTIPADSYVDIISKFDYSNNKRCLAIYLSTTSHFTIQWAYSGYLYYEYNLGLAIVDHAYHIAIVFDGVNKYLYVKIYDKTAESELYNATISPGNAIYVDTGPFYLGRVFPNLTYGPDAILDEVIIANDLFDEAEIDLIRAGLFGAPDAPAPCLSLTFCEAIQVPPDNCLSLTFCEDTSSLPLEPCLSLTACESIEFPSPEPCLSLTFCEPTASGAPSPALSLTKCPDIPLPYGVGGFIMF